MWDFTQPSDLTLLVENKTMLVHRSVLVSASPVFQAMLESDFQEKNSAVIALPGKSLEQMQLFLNFIYPFGHLVTDEKDVTCLLELSREYQVQAVRDACETYLLDKPASLDLLVLAQEFDLALLLDRCVKHVATSCPSDVQQDPRFDRLSDSSKLAITKHQLAKLQRQAKKIRSIVSARDFRYLPDIASIKCSHRPKSTSNPHYICSGCKLSVLKTFLRI